MPGLRTTANAGTAEDNIQDMLAQNAELLLINNQLLRDTKSRVGALEQRADEPARRVKTLERNNTARLQNYHTATHNPHDGKLEPLYSLKTHEAIRDFPKSVVDMPRSEAEIDALLQALEVECRGNVEEKKVVLGTAIGVE